MSKDELICAIQTRLEFFLSSVNQLKKTLVKTFWKIFAFFSFTLLHQELKLGGFRGASHLQTLQYQHEGCSTSMHEVIAAVLASETTKDKDDVHDEKQGNNSRRSERAGL